MSRIANIIEYDGTVTGCFIAEAVSYISANPTLERVSHYEIHTETTKSDIRNNRSKAVRSYSTFEEANAFLDGVSWTLLKAVAHGLGGVNQ